MSQPLVSVIVCVYNGGKYLLSSIQSILMQTYNNLEILVVDDGSTDNSVESAKEKIKDSRIRWYRQENAGKSVALNFALKKIKGMYYAIQDADDISHPRRIERLVECMTEHPDLAGIYSGYDLIINDRHVAPIFRGKTINQCLQDIHHMVMPSHDPTGLYRVSIVKDFFYETTLHIAQGYDYILRVGERYPLMVIADCLYSYRVYWTSVTRINYSKRQKYIHDVWRRACIRRGIDFDHWINNKNSIHWWRRQSKASIRDNGIAAHFIESVISQREIGNRFGAIRTALLCSTFHPFDIHYQKALIYSIVPKKLISLLRKRKYSE